MATQIIPKICEYDISVNNMIDYQIRRARALEIQMLSVDFNESLLNIRHILAFYTNYIDYCVIHLPFCAFYWDVIHCCEHYRNQLDKMISACINISYDFNLKIDILGHLSLSPGMLEITGAVEYLDDILSKISGSNVGILIENSIISLNDDDNRETPEEYIFKNLKHKQLAFCLDLCHLQASENVYEKSIAITPVLLRNLKNIHFSATLNHDGYKDKKNTHGRKHNDETHMLNDLEYLENKGINLDKVNIIAEINEEDYTNRPDLAEEIERYNWLLREGAI